MINIEITFWKKEKISKDPYFWICIIWYFLLLPYCLFIFYNSNDSNNSYLNHELNSKLKKAWFNCELEEYWEMICNKELLEEIERKKEM